MSKGQQNTLGQEKCEVERGVRGPKAESSFRLLDRSTRTPARDHFRQVCILTRSSFHLHHSKVTQALVLEVAMICAKSFASNFNA